ncbi:uncharacterized protein LOC118193712 [Stegodyphus dumicola]|uniref:uncharacterized protein LOC118193712 n=1 Tax=Stegodyphus dumicola TaxID=202533 RepID=UPI0015A8C321|nr:uncharacterized protein LOC118193712 [Stegodyphus dumicola]
MFESCIHYPIMYGSLIDFSAFVVYAVWNVVYYTVENIFFYARETTKIFRIVLQRFAYLTKNGLSYLHEKAVKAIIKFRTYMLTDACMFYIGSILGMSAAWIAGKVFESVLILAVANVFVGLFGSAIIILIFIVKLKNNSLRMGHKIDIYKVMEKHFYCLAVAGIGIHVASFISDSSFTLNLFCVYMSVCLLLAACAKYPSRLAIYRFSLIPMMLIIISMIFGCVFIAGVYINSVAAMCGGCILFAIFGAACVLYSLYKSKEAKNQLYLYQNKRLCCFWIAPFGIINIFALIAGIEGAFKDTSTENKYLMRFFTYSMASIYFSPCFDVRTHSE